RARGGDLLTAEQAIDHRPVILDLHAQPIAGGEVVEHAAGILERARRKVRQRRRSELRIGRVRELEQALLDRARICDPVVHGSDVTTGYSLSPPVQAGKRRARSISLTGRATRRAARGASPPPRTARSAAARPAAARACLGRR